MLIKCHQNLYWSTLHYRLDRGFQQCPTVLQHRAIQRNPWQHYQVFEIVRIPLLFSWTVVRALPAAGTVIASNSYYQYMLYSRTRFELQFWTRIRKRWRYIATSGTRARSEQGRDPPKALIFLPNCTVGPPPCSPNDTAAASSGGGGAPARSSTDTPPLRYVPMGSAIVVRARYIDTLGRNAKHVFARDCAH